MPSAWNGSVGDLKAIAAQGPAALAALLKKGMLNAYGTEAANEVKATSTALHALLSEILSPSEFDPIGVILEMQMPIGTERADVVLLGGSTADKAACVLELKEWDDVTLQPQALAVNVARIGQAQHPSLQVLNYRGKLHFFNVEASGYRLMSAVFVPNMSDHEANDIEMRSPAELVREAPLITYGKANGFTESLRQWLLPCQINPGECKAFSESESGQTCHLVDLLKDYDQAIKDQAAHTIAQRGFWLTQQQSDLVTEVLQAAASEQQKVFIVDGGPGSGKTLTAVTLMLQARQSGCAAVMSMRNKHLKRVLTQCVASSTGHPAAAGLFHHFSTNAGTGVGQKKFKLRVDLLICDEGQRMGQADIDRVISHPGVVVVFLDEHQRLNASDKGTVASFTEACGALKMPIPRELTDALRCRGGREYLGWIDSLLAPQPDRAFLKSSMPAWAGKYALHFCESVNAMLDQLQGLKALNPAARVALAASLTESPGDATDPNSMLNHRIGYPLPSGLALYRGGPCIPWVMNEQYVNFWMSNSCSNLTHVASIYGVQGFESDYMGIIWGRDLVIRDGVWRLGDANICYDAIDGARGLVSSRKGQRQWTKTALELLQNRYRIFLTRGIKGTRIYCEDDETRDFFRRII